jgi:hypothetical protein
MLSREYPEDFIGKGLPDGIDPAEIEYHDLEQLDPGEKPLRLGT